MILLYDIGVSIERVHNRGSVGAWINRAVIRLWIDEMPDRWLN